MLRRMLTLVSPWIFVALIYSFAAGQVGSTSSLTGSVTDPNEAVLAGATVLIKNNATSAEFRTVTAGNGTFSIPALDPGTYIVTISAPGFKQAVITEVKLVAGVPGSIRIGLEVGSTNESVVVQGGGEMVQTQSANIATTLVVNQIAHLPLQTRNVLDFLVLLPGTNTTGAARDSTFNGLPQSTINITIDGVNTQDNFNKTGDGFFSFISPRLDAIEEVTVSTATPGAESAGQGAIQIKLVTRSGNNEFHGSLYEYHRNPALNSNYWFTNRNVTPIHKETGLTCGTPRQPFVQDECKAPRERVLLNQFGFRLGGPIVFPKRLFGPFSFNGRDKAFFFVNYEELRLPTSVNRQRTIFNPLTQQGIFRYNRTVNNQTVVQEVDLLALGARNQQTATIDPLIGKLLADIRNATATTGGIEQLTDPNLQRFTFSNSSIGKRYYPTIRLDFNLTPNHHLENVYNYQKYITTIDTLNGGDPAFPGFPNHGGQFSNRFSESLALRSTLTPTIVNEARVGLTGGTLLFFPDINAGSFTGTVANQMGFNLGGLTGNNSTGIAAAAGINGATADTGGSRRNAPIWEFSDTLTWTRGAHSLTFGGAFTQVNFWAYSQTFVPTINFGVNSNDPANAMFTQANFPGASAANLTAARGIYAALTGRVTSINATTFLDEETGKYAYLGSLIQRGRQRELGFFGQDSWRLRPNLTLNYGLRWELQLPFTPLNGSYSTTTVDDLYGVSGPGNLFKPGTLNGRETQFVQFKKGDRAYNIDYRNFAPSFGFAWSPNMKHGWLKWIVGEGGSTVLRGGYSIAYNRQGAASFSNVFDGNPGASINADRNLTIGNLVGGNLGSLPLLLREPNRLSPPPIPSAPNYPQTGTIDDSAGIFDPGIRVPYTQSWSFGIQREITKDMAVEVRYIHTLNLQQWVTYNLNENNIVENGFLNEFKLAQKNLEIFKAANPGCGQQGRPACSFAYSGLPGQSPLPIMLAYFGGKRNPNDPNNYTAAVLGTTTANLFTTGTFLNALAANNPAPGTFSTNLYADAGRRSNALAAGLPANLFLVNPDLDNANFTGNGGYSRYDGLQVELRRRLSRGLLVQGSYVFAKSFTGTRVSFRSPRINSLGDTLRHAFKANWVYELPIGRGKMLAGNVSGLLDKIIGGWEFHGTARIQSGNALNYGNVRLVGMTRKELQKEYKLRFDDANRIVYILPEDIILNTRRANNVSATDPTGYGALGVPTGRYIAPANSANCIQVVAGDCAPNQTIVYGPMFTRFDLSVLKRVKFSEKTNFELRAEFLNAFNNINFLGTVAGLGGATFGQVTAAYRDQNNTQDPGGRLVQIVARLNF